MIFYPFTPSPTENPKNQDFEKLKKIAGEIIISHLFTKNHNHMRHGSWDTGWHRQNFWSLWAIFCPFTPLTIKNLKNKNFEKMKKVSRDVIILHECTKYHNHTMHASWDMERNRQNFFSLAATFFCPFTQIKTWKIKTLKKWKKQQQQQKKTPGDIILLHLCTTNENRVMYGSWDMERDRQNFLSFWTIFLHFYPPNPEN